MARRDIIASHFREPKHTNDPTGLQTLATESVPVIAPAPAAPPQTIPVETENSPESFDIPIHERD